MIHREKNKYMTIKNLANVVYGVIMTLDEETEISIGEIVKEYLQSKQYAFVYIDNKYGWIWTKDNGLTYIIKDRDLFKVMNIVEKNSAN